MLKRLALAAIILTATGAPATIAQEDRELAFPENYRSEFTRYYSGGRLLAEEQTIAIYANDIALEGARAGGKMPYGSVLVAEIYAAQKDADGELVESMLGDRLPGEFKAIALMQRGEGWDDQYPDDLKVGDWEFEVFSTAGKNLGKDTTSCRECHHAHGETEYMYSLEHLAAAK